MRFGSVCSGIEAASVAWEPLGWKAAWFSEIEPFPSAVLAHHYPDTPNYGDMTTLPDRILSGEVDAPDLFCGGTPCQAFSVAGLRQSLADARGNLSLTFVEIANAIDSARSVRRQAPSIIFWENVPGVLSTKDNAFGCFLGALAGCDTALVPRGRWTDAGVVAGPQRTVAWRTLDAQYFGVAQRRRRVFVVASAGDGFDPAAVLLEFDGVRRDSAPSREAGQRVAPTIAGCANGGGANGPGRDVDSVESLQVAMRESGQGYWMQDDLAGTLRAEGEDRPSRPSHVIGMPVVFHSTQDPISSTEVCHAIGTGSKQRCATAAVAVAFHENQRAEVTVNDTAGSLKVGGGKPGQGYPALLTAMQVRRLTPVECERLQGFPDNYTAIPWRNKPADQCPDGSRYKALGNSWAVPVVRWIGRRIQSGADA